MIKQELIVRMYIYWMSEPSKQYPLIGIAKKIESDIAIIGKSRLINKVKY